MSETTIDYKEKTLIEGVILSVVLLFLYIVGEPFIEVWNHVIAYTTEHITKIRFFVYLLASISVFLMLLIFYSIYRRFGRVSAFLFFISLHLIDLTITGDNKLIKIITLGFKSFFNWLFGNV